MKIIIGALVGVCSAIIGAILTYFLSKKLVRQTHKNALEIIQITEFNKAAVSFRCAFTKEIRLLSIIHPGHSPEFQKTYDMLKIAYVRHQNAVISFEPYLIDPCLTAFKTKWKEYCCYNEQSQQPTFSDYKTGVSHNDELQVRNLAISRIKALLKFARPIKIKLIQQGVQVDAGKPRPT